MGGCFGKPAVATQGASSAAGSAHVRTSLLGAAAHAEDPATRLPSDTRPHGGSSSALQQQALFMESNRSTGDINPSVRGHERYLMSGAGGNSQASARPSLAAHSAMPAGAPYLALGDDVHSLGSVPNMSQLVTLLQVGTTTSRRCLATPAAAVVSAPPPRRKQPHHRSPVNPAAMRVPAACTPSRRTSVRSYALHHPRRSCWR